MEFVKQHPNYKTYKSDTFYVNEFPKNIQNSTEVFLANIAESNANVLRRIIDILAQYVNTGLTENFSWSYLISDLKHSLNALFKTDFNNFFDFLYDLYNADLLLPGDINKFLEKNHLGYRLSLSVTSYEWELLEDCSSSVINRAEELIIEPQNICEQTKEHLKQLINNINTGSDRAMKDALRDALSALEALMKHLTNTNEIKHATNELKKLNIAPDFLIKDGLAIWDRIHEVYPDVRHGNPNIKNISKADLHYCLNKILIYIEYLCDLNPQI